VHPGHACDGWDRGRTRRRRPDAGEILREYPYLEAEDIAEALSNAAWRAEEVEVPLRCDDFVQA
jgi:hypothetical protein